MKRFLLFFFLSLVFVPTVFSQSPTTDIYLADIKFPTDTLKKNPVISNVKNATARKGYDNQPFFSYDGKFMFYSAMTKDSTMDIFKYDMKKGKAAQLTNTPGGSEFSPRADFAGGGILTVRIEEDQKTQRLWKYNESGKGSLPYIPWLDSVGYYYQLTNDLFFFFILGPKDVATLRMVDLNAKKEILVVDDSVGRCFCARPVDLEESDKNVGASKIELFYVITGRDEFVIRRALIFKRNTSDTYHLLELKDLGTTKNKAQDFIMDFNTMLMAFGNELFTANVEQLPLTWTSTGFKLEGVKTITRLAYHASTGKLAMVADDGKK